MALVWDCTKGGMSYSRRVWAVVLLSYITALLLVAVPRARADVPEGIVTETLATKLVPGPVTFSVLLPSSYASSGEVYPLLISLHGGDGDHRALHASAPVFKKMWAEGALPEMVVVTPTATQSGYLDYRDGSQLWETFITGEFLAHLRSNYRVSKERKGTFIGGVSMGGGGSLMIGLKHLDTFAAIVAYEPFVDAAYTWQDAKPRNMFYAAGDPVDRFGDPIDEVHWASNNPATIVRDNADAIRASGIQIYIEVGSEDALDHDKGTEFLHRTLFDHNIRHEYRYVYGADHVGASMARRVPDGLTFLSRVVNPPPPDPVAEAFHDWADAFKKRVGFVE